MRSDKLNLKLLKQSLDQLFRCLLNMEAERTRRNSRKLKYNLILCCLDEQSLGLWIDSRHPISILGINQRTLAADFVVNTIDGTLKPGKLPFRNENQIDTHGQVGQLVANLVIQLFKLVSTILGNQDRQIQITVNAGFAARPRAENVDAGRMGDLYSEFHCQIDLVLRRPPAFAKRLVLGRSSHKIIPRLLPQ